MGGGGAMHLAALYPNVFAAAISTVGWIDLNAWVPASDMCQPGVRWKTANGPLCTQMLDQVFLTQQATTDLPPLMLTWNSNDGTVSPARYPALISALETTRQGYVAEWRQNDHFGFSLAGDPHLRYRLNEPFLVFTGGGSDPSSATGARQTDRSWSDLSETPTQLTVTVAGTGTSSITVRRRQSFRPAAGTTVTWNAGSASGSVVVGANGGITIPAFNLVPGGTTIRLTTAAGG
jgi:hypothetical protein